MDQILEYHKEISRTENKNQESLFNFIQNKSSLPGLKLKKASAATLEEKLQWEKVIFQRKVFRIMSTC